MKAAGELSFCRVLLGSCLLSGLRLKEQAPVWDTLFSMGEARTVEESEPNHAVILTASSGIGKTSRVSPFHWPRLPKLMRQKSELPLDIKAWVEKPRWRDR